METDSSSDRNALTQNGSPCLAARVAELEERLRKVAGEQSRIQLSPTSSQALRDSEERFRLLAENSTDMISRHAPDGTYVYVSPACRTLLGREPHEIIGKGAYDFILPEDHPVVRKAHDLQLDTAHANATTYRLMHSDGHAVWVESTTRCITDARGNILEIQASTRDVTDRVHTQQALAQSEELYRSLIEGASDIIMRLDADYRILFVNRAMPRETREMLLGRSFLDRVIPAHHELACRALDKVFNRNEPASAEVCITSFEGEQMWYFIRFAPIQEDSQTVAATVIATDITLRKETEKALVLVRSAIENVQDAVIITTAELELPGPEIVYVNKAFERMTGYTAAEILGTTPRVLQGPRTDRALLSKLKVTLQAQKVFHGETYNYRKDGSEYYLEWDISPVRDEQGRIMNYVSVQRDLTELRRQEELNRQHQTELAHVGRLSTMGEMASGLAHELNQPLTAITNYTRGCLRRLNSLPHADPKIAEAIEAAAMQADRAGQIIRRLRQFIRKRVPQHMPVAINDVVRDAVALIAGETRQHQINLVLRLHDPLPMVKADHVQLEQVVLNLMRNGFEALVHLPAKDRQVMVHTRPDRDGVRLSVVDSGKGMDPATRLRIFEPFFTTKNRGMGMGLPICQSIIESHSGRLWVEEDPPTGHTRDARESGAMFHFWLPPISQEDLIQSQFAQDASDFI